MNAAGELGDLRDDVQSQPAGVAEQARVREFACREIQRELVVGHVEIASEVREVLRKDRGHPVGHDGDADVAPGDDLERETPDHTAELGGEQRAADAAHERAGTRHQLTHLLGGLLVDRGCERAGDRVRDGLRELLPDGQRRLDPLPARHRDGRGRELGDRRGLAQPQRGEGERLVELGPICRRDAESVLVRKVQSLGLRGRPVDAAVVRPLRERRLHLRHHLPQHRGVDPHA